MLQIIYKAEERFKTIKLSLDTDQHNRHTTANGNICKILQQYQLHKSFILNSSTSTIIPIFSSNKLPFKLNIVNAKKTRTKFNNNICTFKQVQGKGGPYSTAKHRVRELIPVLGSQHAGDVSHKPGSRLPLLSTRPAVTNFAAW